LLVCIKSVDINIKETGVQYDRGVSYQFIIRFVLTDKKQCTSSIYNTNAMGSNQSTPSSAAPSDEVSKSSSSITNNNSNTIDKTTASQSSDGSNANTNTSKIKRTAPKNESGYARAERLCRKKKRVYDACYTAALSSKEEDCEELFDTYRSCFLKAMTKDMEKRGIQVNSGSMVGEFKEEVEDDE